MTTDVERIGTMRRLARLATGDGYFCVAALDHPENYLLLFDRDVSRVPYQEVVASKLELAAALARQASALLLDPVWSFGQAIATGTLPGQVGVLVPVELLDYQPDTRLGWDAATRLRPKWTPEKIARLGADGVKLVVFYRADLEGVAAGQRKLFADLVADCRCHDLPVVVEPLWYPVGDEDPTDPAVARARAAAIVAAAAEFATLGADILKVQFPGAVAGAADRAAAAAAARDLDAGCAVPWVLLSEGAGFDDFAVQMEIAARAGASGYIAGRAIWGDAVGNVLPVRDLRADRRSGAAAFLSARDLRADRRSGAAAFRPDAERGPALARAADRLAALNAIVRAHGRPWTERIPVEAIGPDWYESYGE